MKKTLLIILLFLSGLSLYGQFEGFWGLRFGQNIEEVKNIIDKRTSSKGISKDGTLIYYNVNFAGRTAKLASLYYDQGKLYGGIFWFYPEQKPQIFSLYEGIKKDISSKWWRPQVEKEEYLYPFDGDKESLQALEGGYAKIGSIWFYPARSKSDENGSISLFIDSKCYLTLMYSDGVISKKVSSREAMENAKDL